MWARFIQYFSREKLRFGLTKEELERTDMDYDEEWSEFDYERLIIKGGRPTGITAIMTNDKVMVTEVSEP